MAKYIGVDASDMIHSLDAILNDLTSEVGPLFRGAQRAGEHIARDVRLRFRRSLSFAEFAQLISRRREEISTVYDLVVKSISTRSVVYHGHNTIRIRVGNIWDMTTQQNAVGRWYDVVGRGVAGYNAKLPAGAEKGRRYHLKPGEYFIWDIIDKGAKQHPIYGRGARSAQGQLVTTRWGARNSVYLSRHHVGVGVRFAINSKTSKTAMFRGTRFLTGMMELLLAQRNTHIDNLKQIFFNIFKKHSGGVLQKRGAHGRLQPYSPSTGRYLSF